MPGPDETFIVRVRPEEGDAVLEQPRRSRRRRVRDVSEIGPLIGRWLGQPTDLQEDAMSMHPFLIVAVAAGLAAAGCGEDDTGAAPERAAGAGPTGTVLQVKAKPSGGNAYRFDVERLEAKAGLVKIAFDNRDEFAHNVRIQSGEKCCFKDGSTDVGGTDTTNGGTQIEGTARLKPGRYVFLCSIGGHYDGEIGRMRGTLVVT